MTKYEIISCIISIISMILVLAGVIYAGIQLFIMRKVNKNIHEWNRRKTTYDLLKDFSSGYFPELLDELNSMSKLHIDQSTNYGLVFKQIQSESQHDFDRKLSQVLNFFEGIAISIKNHIIDEDICYDYAALIYQIYYNWSISYIRKRRNELGEPSLYIDFENLSKRWINKLKEENDNIQKSALVPGKEKLD